jgi:hypothetical protein
MPGYVDENTAIRTLFNAGWGDTTPVVYENESFDPPSDQSFVKVFIKPDDAFQHEIGSTAAQFRHPGLIFVMIFSSPDKGNAAALALADQAADIFRRQRSTFTDGRILYRAPTVRPIGITDEGYFHVNVVIPYIRDSYHT